jgi:hypothetical protein
VLGRARLFLHQAGALLGAPTWLGPRGVLLDVASPPRGLTAAAEP